MIFTLRCFPIEIKVITGYDGSLWPRCSYTGHVLSISLPVSPGGTSIACYIQKYSKTIFYWFIHLIFLYGSDSSALIKYVGLLIYFHSSCMILPCVDVTWIHYCVFDFNHTWGITWINLRMNNRYKKNKLSGEV